MKNEDITNPSRFDLIKQAAERVSETGKQVHPVNLVHAADAHFINEMKKLIPEELLGKVIW